MSQHATSELRASRALDAANFFLADVRDGTGPYLAIYLLTEQKWDEARIGMVMSIAGFAGIVAQTPAGALIDATKAKRLVMIAAALVVTSASLLLTLFHLSNAAMLPLVGQKLALQDRNLGTSLMSACIIAAQIVMVPMAMLVGAKADDWGHKRFFLAALLILPIRGALYTQSNNPAWLVGVQLLDGVGAGIFGAIFPVIVADLMRNTGRFSVAQGAIITAQSIGAALSTTLAGLVVVNAGYSAAFLTLGAIAAIGAVVCFFTLPEPRERA